MRHLAVGRWRGIPGSSGEDVQQRLGPDGKGAIDAAVRRHVIVFDQGFRAPQPIAVWGGQGRYAPTVPLFGHGTGLSAALAVAKRNVQDTGMCQYLAAGREKVTQQLHIVAMVGLARPVREIELDAIHGVGGKGPFQPRESR
jgi:hypothetical protein